MKQMELTPWVSSLTYPKKPNGKLRIGLNPKDLNKAIIREHHKAPTLEEIAHVLTGAMTFLKGGRKQSVFWNALNRASITAYDVQHTPW